jgi:CheY-like chemotaxis protein
VAQPLVLAIEPDLRQAAIVKRIVKEKAFADVAVVDSRDAAIEAIRKAMPDVLLLSALLSPRDEDELMAHLRTLENAGHIQTHTIPQLASALDPGEGRSSRGLFSAFSKKKRKEPQQAAGGCDPDLFAEEIRVFLQQAADKKRELMDAPRPAVDVRSGSSRKAQTAGPKQEEAEAAPTSGGSSWSSPFEWKPAGERAVAQQPLRDDAPEMPFVPPAPLEPMIDREPIASGPIVTPLVEAPPGPAPLTGEPLIWRPGAVVVPPAAPLIEPAPMAAAPDPLVESIVAPLIPEPEPQPVVMAATEAPMVESLVAESPVVEAAIVEAAVAEAPIAVTPAPVADAHEPVRERAEKIVALVQEQVATLEHALPRVQKNDEWTNNARDARINDRLGPLARWARKEAKGKAKSAPVTADDVRALIASLSVPPAVASVTYARGCRIRRVRVPPAGSERSDSVGAVILSRRLLAEQRERRPSA